MTVAFIDSVHPVLWERLTAAGHVCIDLSNIPAEGIAEQLAEAEGIVVRGRVLLDAPLLDRAPRLRFIARAGSGLENIDRVACAERDILVLNSPEGNRDAVAEHAVALLLGLMNHVRRADAEVRQGLWRRAPNSGHELGGRTVGIIGFGNTGRAFARKLAGFDVRIRAHDKYVQGFGSAAVIESSLDEVLGDSDVVSLHLPLTNETAHYADAAFFARIARPVWFLNTARGPLTDTAALLDAITAGRVRGAGLDVLEQEERSLLGLRADADPLLQRLYDEPRVLLTPHIAGVTEESYFKLANVLADKILRHFPSVHG